MSQNKFTISIIQMSCSADPAQNLDKIIAKIREAARRGAQVICTQELFRSQYFCQLEDPAIFDLAESIPGRSTETLAKLAKELNVAIVASLFERRTLSIYHNTAAILDADGPPWAFTARCTSPMTRFTTKNIISPPATWASKSAPNQIRPHWRLGLLGPVVSRSRPPHRPAGLSVLFYPTAIGWHPKEKAALWRGPIQRVGNHPAAPTPSPTAFTSPAPTASAWKKSPARPGGPKTASDFFGSSFIADPFGRLLQKASRDQDEILIA